MNGGQYYFTFLLNRVYLLCSTVRFVASGLLRLSSRVVSPLAPTHTNSYTSVVFVRVVGFVLYGIPCILISKSIFFSRYILKQNLSNFTSMVQTDVCWARRREISRWPMARRKRTILVFSCDSCQGLPRARQPVVVGVLRECHSVGLNWRGDPEKAVLARCCLCAPIFRPNGTNDNKTRITSPPSSPPPSPAKGPSLSLSISSTVYTSEASKEINKQTNKQTLTRSNKQ